MEHESDGDTNCNCCYWYSHQRIGERTGRLGNKSTDRDYKTIALLRSASILRSVLEILSLRIQWKTISYR